MVNFSIKTDLLKLKNSFVTNLKGKTATKRCLVIPIDDSNLFVGEKGVYLKQSSSRPAVSQEALKHRDATTGMITLIDEKRRFVGFELDKQIFDYAEKRINNKLSQPTLW